MILTYVAAAALYPWAAFDSAFVRARFQPCRNCRSQKSVIPSAAEGPAFRLPRPAAASIFISTVFVHPSTIEMQVSGYPIILEGKVMADIERISAQQAHTKAASNQALLVCAYEDEAKCRMLNLDGSISFTTFRSRVNSLPKSQEIIFY